MNTQLRGHKFTREQILVFDTNSAFVNTTSYTDILDASTATYQIADGRGGILLKDTPYFNMLAHTTNLTNGDHKRFTIIQGTGVTDATTLTGHPHQEKPYLESMPIDTRFPIYFTKAYVVNEMFAGVLVTGYSGTLSKTNHSLNVNQPGVRIGYQNGVEMMNGVPFSYLTPDYATLGTSAANAKNDIYTNLAHKANLVSSAVKTVPTQAGNQPFVVLAIGVSGTGSTQSTAAGTLNTPQISAIIAGTVTSLDFMVITRNGVSQKQTLKVTTALREMLAKGVADSTLTATDRIRVIEKATALTGTGVITKLLFVALDSKKAVATDRQSAVKTDIIVTPNQLADLTPTITRIANSYEGQGKGRQWLIKWQNDVKGNVNTLQQYGASYSFIEMPDYVKEPTNYNVFLLLHGFEDDNFSPNDEHYYATYLLVPNMIPVTVTGASGGTDAEIYAQVDENGKIISTYIADGGTSYAGALTFAISPVYGGTGATFTGTIVSNAIATVTITGAGSGYSNIAPIGATATQSLNGPAGSLDTLLGWLTTEDGTTIAID